jgi:hypothetical protein
MLLVRNGFHASSKRTLRRAALAATLTLSVLGFGASAAQAGPLVLMGIDAEDGGVGGHGPVSVYQNVVNGGVLANVTNGGSGILVIGGGKNPGDNVTTFWNAIDSATPGSVTYVNGAANIASRSFAGFAMIAVASSVAETPSGGLTAAENTALAGRQSDIASFVNAGGGLMGLSQTGLPGPYTYLPDANQFTINFPPQYSNITATVDGNAVGINDSLDICCWHDEYTAFPAFLKVLARNASTNNPAAIGGANVIVPTDVMLDPPSATNPVGTTHTVTATVSKQGVAQAGVLVTWTVSGANAGATGTCVPADCRTDANGHVSFTYTGTNAGTDTITASFVDAQGQTVTGTASKLWVAAKISINDVTVNEGNAGTTPATFKVTLDQAVGVEVKVDYATANGTATAGSDYVAKAGTVTFAPNDTSEDVTVLVNGDTVNEDDETFLVNLTQPTGALIADGQGVGTIIDDERNGQFSCRASALNLLGLLEPVVANRPNNPCRDDTAGLISAALNTTGLSAAVGVPNAKTDQTPNDLTASPPAVGDKATAHADTTTATISLGIAATATESDAKAECTSAGVPTLSASGKVVGLKVNGQTYNVLTGPVNIPLLLATLKINNTTTTSNSIRRRAIWLDNVLLPDVVVSESIADYSGNPCDS